VFSSLGWPLIAADDFSFHRLLTAGVERMLLRCLSLTVMAEVTVCMETQQACSEDLTAAHSACVHSSKPALACFSTLGPVFVNLAL